MADSDDKDDKNTPPDWKTGLGDLAAHEKISGFKTVSDLANAFLNAPTAPVLPESAEGYTLPETVKIKGLRKMALENKLTQDQLNGVLRFNGQATKMALDGAKARREAAMGDLKKDWGDKYDANTALIDRTLKHFDKEGHMTELLTKTGMKSEPKVLKFLHSIGASLGEDTFERGDENVNNNRKKSAAARLFPNHPSST